LIPLRKFPHFSSTFSFGRRFKKHVIKFGQDSLQISSIIPARTKTILEVLDAIGISYYDFSTYYLCNKPCGSVAVTTYPQILDDAEWHTRRCADEPKCNSQLLTTVAQMKDFFFLLYILLQIQAARNQ
jgi:hypothetical protein